MGIGSPHGPRPLALLAVLLLSVSCVDEQIVYRDRELFEDPPVGAVGMLGYTDEESKLTVCGNCHIDFQSQWENTAHADAWNTLQESGHAQSFCESCHSVTQLGNAQDAPAGHETTEDTRYYDVQCESCHGPGLAHVQAPDATQPFAPVAVGVDLSTGCGECHNGTHHPFVEEWAQSGHGAVVTSAASRDACAPCHTGEDALIAFGVNADYLEKPDVLGSTTEHLAITCAVCHDPHAADHGGQLRYPIDEPNEEENLCMKCHHKRGVPDFTTFRGPHSPEGPVLLGYGGWWPPGMTFADEIVSSHGSPERNPRLCAGCHVNAFELEDELTGEPIISVGHMFESAPCVDGSGRPTGETECAIQARTFRSCVAAGCHPSEQSAAGAMTAELLLEQNLASQIAALLEQIQPGWQACYLGSGNCGAGSPLNFDNTFTSAEGAAFNWQIATGYPASAIHNPFLMRALLAASITQLQEDYGVPLPPGLTAARLRELMRPITGR